ncbi:MAG: hypothetical protein K1V99_02925 [Bacteroidales bacterium]
MKTLLKIDVDSRDISECTCDIECEKDEQRLISSLIALMAKSEDFERVINFAACYYHENKDEMKKTCELAHMSAIAKLNNKCKS